ncbi:unnamed protein product [Protopolystoma xenopodis]|uniref:Uncharacterized protein n=1 Tax=Protopolystoma xenopodis TaxID=117903 RepID=A0A448XAH3_9PLAT|nr:unnamed protein product [Protopolystoma xenopodis]
MPLTHIFVLFVGPEARLLQANSKAASATTSLRASPIVGTGGIYGGDMMDDFGGGIGVDFLLASASSGTPIVNSFTGQMSLGSVGPATSSSSGDLAGSMSPAIGVGLNLQHSQNRQQQQQQQNMQMALDSNASSSSTSTTPTTEPGKQQASSFGKKYERFLHYIVNCLFLV